MAEIWPVSESVKAPLTGTHPTSSPLPLGGLTVYDKGKEIFSLPAARESGVENAAELEADRGETSTASAESSVLHRVEPEYPEEARKQGIEGTVVADVYIDGEGKVLEVKTISGPPQLTQAVVDAVKQWTFKPHDVGGHPVAMQTNVTLNFRLPH